MLIFPGKYETLYFNLIASSIKVPDLPSPSPVHMEGMPGKFYPFRGFCLRHRHLNDACAYSAHVAHWNPITNPAPGRRSFASGVRAPVPCLPALHSLSTNDDDDDDVYADLYVYAMCKAEVFWYHRLLQEGAFDPVLCLGLYIYHAFAEGKAFYR